MKVERKQIVQIKRMTQKMDGQRISDYDKTMKAVKKLQRAYGYKDTADVFMGCMLEAAEQLG